MSHAPAAAKTSSRRSVIKKMAGSAAMLGVASSLSNRLIAADMSLDEKLKGRINHSVCQWCYKGIPLEDLCKSAQKIGLQSIELLGPNEWPTLQKYGLSCAMANGAGMGIDEPEYRAAKSGFAAA